MLIYESLMPKKPLSRWRIIKPSRIKNPKTNDWLTFSDRIVIGVLGCLCLSLLKPLGGNLSSWVPTISSAVLFHTGNESAITLLHTNTYIQDVQFESRPRVIAMIVPCNNWYVLTVHQSCWTAREDCWFLWSLVLMSFAVLKTSRWMEPCSSLVHMQQFSLELLFVMSAYKTFGFCR